MGIFNTLITQPLGYIIKVIYNLTGNYGVSIILFTFITRLIMLPLSIKQQKSMVRMQKLNPLMENLKKKYKNDKEKLNQETVKLYQKYKINPMGGCLPLLIQFPVLIGLIQVIYKPVSYILGKNTQELLTQFPDISQKGLVEIELAKRLGDINFSFLGIDLSAIPSYMQISTLWIIPLLAALATYLSGKIMQSGQAKSADSTSAQMNQSMTTIFPIMTLFFTFTMPVAASLYWFISSAVQTAQQFVLNKVIKADDLIIEEGGNKR